MPTLTNIENAGSHQLSLVNDLLDLTKIEAGRFEPRMESASLVDICQDAVQMMQAQAGQAGVDLELSITDAIDEIISDRRRVRQVLLNLIGNAIKFTPAGGRVSVDLTTCVEEALISVRDTGVGMSEDEIPRIC